jgi:hypothetical protein
VWTWWPGIALWLNADRWIAMIGLVLTTAGTAVAVWQIRKVAGAAESARTASRATAATLRSASLGRLIQLSIECRRRITQPHGLAISGLRVVLGDWLTAYEQIFPLIVGSKDIGDDAKDRAIEILEVVKGHVRTTLDYLDRRTSSSPKPDLSNLRSAFVEYDTTMSGIVLLLEDAEVARHG